MTPETTTASETTPTVPDDVQSEIDSDTKATSRSRFQKLLRDVYYAGPIKRGGKPEKNLGQNTSTPGSDLRRSRDGALWNLTEKQETLLLETAINLELLKRDANGAYYTTNRGAHVLSALDRCDSCDEQRVPNYKERTVQISRYTSGKNHSLETNCPDCDDGSNSWSRDEFPPIHSTNDNAERLARSHQNAALYGTDIGEWMPPERRALTDFIDIVQEESHRDFEHTLTRNWAPSRLAGGSDGLRQVFNDYSADVCTDFAALLLETFYGQCLSDVERNVIEHVAAGYPDGPDHESIHTHAGDAMEPVAVVEGDTWEATLYFEATGEYVTISDQAEKTAERVRYETGSGMDLSINSPGIGRVTIAPRPREIDHREFGDVATLVAFKVTNEDSYSEATRIEEAFETITRSVNEDSHNGKTHLESTFKKVANNRSIKTSTFGSNSRHDLNDSELVKLARRVIDEIDVKPSPLVQRYARRELK